VAGNGYARGMIDEINKRCKEHNITHEIVLTQRKRHATELSKQFADKGYDHIIAVGGDGTINETASGIIGRKGITFGVIAAGTGNDLIQIMGYNNHFNKEDWDAFFRQETICMDVGVCNGNHFYNGMGLGFDAQVAAENYSEDEKHEVKRGSKNKYIWHILKTLIFYKEKSMIASVDGVKKETRCFMNTVAIGRRFAGSFFLTPCALADDGLLDVCAIEHVSFPGRIAVFLNVPKGTHVGMKPVNYYQTDRLELEFKEKVPYHLDGELYFDSKFNISLIHCGLSVIYNSRGNHYFKRTGSESCMEKIPTDVV
jgi:diacylglycerol kinase (ATP)